MQLLPHTPYPFSFPPPKPLNPKLHHLPHPFPPLLFSNPSPLSLSAKCFSSDEFPVDETFLENFGPKDKETEDEARRRNWIERGWAPWEEILTPEADFARKSLNEGEEVPLQSPEAIEAFHMLNPSYREKRRKELGLTEAEWYAKQFEIKGEIPERLSTLWAGPLVVRQVAPRDWPPRGWEVDREELRFIREGHRMMSERVDFEDLDARVNADAEKICLDRYKVFLKQYQEWVDANKDRLEEESYQYDQDYHPGRRKRGKDYEEGMYELPFYYPGQICEGKVTTLHLYQGAFVDVGGVYDGIMDGFTCNYDTVSAFHSSVHLVDVREHYLSHVGYGISGWVPIKGNDWYWIRHHIKVGMHVIVEILAKRDPYRFRFPLEMRFVHPNIDHLIFNRFDFPPIFHHDEDTNPDELRRDCGRPPVPRKDPGTKPEEEPLLSNHPYVEKLWQIHVAEQMILDDLEANPEKYQNKKLSELVDDDDYDEQRSVEYTKTYYKKSLIPKVIMKTSVKELELEAASAEREFHNKMRREAEERGEKYKISQLRRNMEMDEYDLMHWRRSFEEREALIRDISCRQALGLPLEEPGKHVDASYFGKDQYDPSNPLYRYDYWGEPKNSEKSKQQRMTDAHNKSIVGKGVVWYEMSYEDAIKQKMQREASGAIVKEVEDTESDDNDEEEEDDFDYSILSDPSISLEDQHQPVVNGTESSRLSDEGMFED